LLPQARAVIEDQDTDAANTDTAKTEADEHFGEIHVFYQMFKGVPMQIKLVRGEEERRVAVPQRFMDAAAKAQPSAENLILERQWVEKGVRYGEMDEVAAQLVEEISAAYDEERLDRLVSRAFEAGSSAEELFSVDEVLRALADEDWRKRYAAVERMDLTEETIPALQKALKDEKMSIRRLATAYLGEIGGEYGGEKVLPILYEALQDASPIVRRTAGDAISDIGDPAAIEQMKAALQDRNKLVRWRAARYMFEVGDESAVDALKAAKDDPEFEVSLQVQLALERIEHGEQAEGTVWQQMTRRNDERK
jgi:HEAT repeat protein